MVKFAWAGLGVMLFSLGLVAETGRPQAGRVAKPPVAPVASHGAAVLGPDEQKALVQEYCQGCHNDVDERGGLSLDAFDLAHPERQAELSEKIIRKLRAGMMPPPGRQRPEAATIVSLASSIETRIDTMAAANPNPGRRPFQRLNRAEYGRAVRDLLGVDVDVNLFLPPDTISHGFDNVADVQVFSPTLLEGYLRAAAKISTLALGDPDASPTAVTYKVPRTASQLAHVDGAPFGTRGGVSVVHTFPADGEYVFKLMLHSIPTGQLYGSTVRGEQIEVSVDGERVALLDINPKMSESDPNGMTIQTSPIAVKAGPRRLSAAFLGRADGPVDDLIAPIEYTLADTQIGSALGVTALPHLRDFSVTGPIKVTGLSDTAIRRRVFTCRPTTAADEQPCARRIVTDLASRAFRRPADAPTVAGLMTFYDAGRKDGDFEAGIRRALQAVLASPHFLFRLEQAPANLSAGQTYRISDLDLASRLSYFLWGAGPDRELLALAGQGTLKTPAVLEKQVHRMLADPRAEALATRFAAQWLRLQDLDGIHPDALLFPQYDQTLAQAMRRETELFFDAIVRDDRPVLELLTADYTFVNERLARHYGMPNVAGTAFRRVAVADANRHGLLGHGSILTLTSVADRTSPVMRGKWVMEVLLGTPPPAPPPNVPALETTSGVKGGKLLSVRERMEDHRRNPTCRSCHRVIDPIGLALEPFDATGAWRIKDNGVPVDAAGELFDGSPVDGPVSLRKALLKNSEALLRSFTDYLMTYALGRRLDPQDMPAVRTIVRDAGRADHRFSAYVLGIVKSPAFQMSRADAAAAPSMHHH